MQKSRYLITYYDGGQLNTARFSAYDDAVYFAKHIAGRHSVEMHRIGHQKHAGIIGQWKDGKVTREFQGRDLPDAEVAQQ